MSSYRFAATVYRISGRTEYVDQAIRTPRGCVSYDAETGETIMHMAVRNGDIATIQTILDTIPDASVIMDRDGVRAMSIVTDLIVYLSGLRTSLSVNAAIYFAIDILRRMIISIIAGCSNYRTWLLTTCIQCSTNHTSTVTAASGVVTQIIADYAKTYAPPTHHDITTTERVLCSTMAIYAAFGAGNTQMVAELMRNTRDRVVLDALTPEILAGQSLDTIHVLQGRAKLRGQKRDQQSLYSMAKSAAEFVFDDVACAPRVNVFGLQECMTAWNYAHEYRWRKLADVLERTGHIPRYHKKSWLISIICKMCRAPESGRILRALLHRWPNLNSEELTAWMTSRNEDECALLLDYGQISREDFTSIERNLCESICREHWDIRQIQYARMRILLRLAGLTP